MIMSEILIALEVATKACGLVIYFLCRAISHIIPPQNRTYEDETTRSIGWDGLQGKRS